MAAISNRTPPVIVEYDLRGGRAERMFTCPFEAKRFYAVKLKANKNPKLKKVVEQ